MTGARQLIRLAPSEIAHLCRGVLVLTLIEFALRCRSLPWVADCLGVQLDLTSRPPAASALEESALGRRERRLVALSLKLSRQAWPFSGVGPCLREALLVGNLLRDHRPHLLLGVKDADSRVAAHAWLEVAGGVYSFDPDYHALGRLA